MCDRRRDQEPVAVCHQPVLADLADQRVNRIMRVQNALGPSGRTGGVEDHAHRVGIQHRQHRGRLGLEHRGVRRMAVTADDHDQGGEAIDAVTRSSIAA